VASLNSITSFRGSRELPKPAQARVKQGEQGSNRRNIQFCCKQLLKYFGVQSESSPIVQTLAQTIDQWRPFANIPVIFPLLFSMFNEVGQLSQMDESNEVEIKKLEESFFNFTNAYLKEYSFFLTLEILSSKKQSFEKTQLHIFSKKYAKRCKPFADKFLKELGRFSSRVKTGVSKEQQIIMNKIVVQLMSKIRTLATLCAEEIQLDIWEKAHNQQKNPIAKIVAQYRANGGGFSPSNTFDLPPPPDCDEDHELAMQGFNFFEKLNEQKPFFNEEQKKLFKELRKALLDEDIVRYQTAQQKYFSSVSEMAKAFAVSQVNYNEVDYSNENRVFEAFGDPLVYILSKNGLFISSCAVNLEKKIQRENPFYLTQENLIRRCELHLKKLSKKFSTKNINSFPGKKEFFDQFEADLKKWHANQGVRHLLDSYFFEIMLGDQEAAESKLSQARFSLAAKDVRGVPRFEKISKLMTRGCGALEAMGDHFMSNVQSKLKKVSRNAFTSKKDQIVQRWKELSFPVVDKILAYYYLLRLCETQRLQGKTISQISAMQIEEDERLSGLIRYLSFPEHLQKVKYQDLHIPAQKKQKPRKVEAVKEKQVSDESTSVQEKSAAEKETEIALKKTEDGTFKLKAPVKEYSETPVKATTREEESKQSEESKKTQEVPNSELEREKLMKELKQAHKFRDLMSLLRRLGYKDVIQGSSHTLIQIGSEKFPIARHGGSHSISRGVRHSLARSIEKDKR
jgi:hypothetical protein